MKIFLAFLISLPAVVLASEWAPPITNQYTWNHDSGILGGVPVRTTIYRTLTTASNLSGLNNSWANCPSNQVIQMNAGTWTFSGTINIDSAKGVTMRGSTNANGYPTTIINSSADPAIGSNPNGLVYAGNASLASGYTAGSTSIVFSATPDAQIAVGNLMQVGATDNDLLVFTTGASLGQHRFTTHLVLSKSGNTVTFDPPLPMTFASSDSPYASYLNGGPGSRMCGVENIVFNGTASAGDLFSGWGVEAMWFKNCVFSNMVQDCVYFYGSTRCEVRHCYFPATQSFPNNADGYSIYTYEGTSHTRIEDNYFAKMFTAHWQTGGGGANVIAFNFATNSGAQTITDRQLADFRSNHGACPMMNLYEGNIMCQFHTDAYHGNDIYATLFRNWSHGLHPTATDNRIMMNISRGSYYYVVAGNILGNGAWSPTHYEMTGQPDYTTQKVIYRLGYPGTFSNGTDPGDIDPVWPRYTKTYPDTNVSFTLMRHGNYDYKNAAIVNLAGQDTTLPNSLLYPSGKPTYFGNLSWPAFSPSAPAAASSLKIPAGYRIANSFADPPASGGGPGTNAVLKAVRWLGKFNIRS